MTEIEKRIAETMGLRRDEPFPVLDRERAEWRRREAEKDAEIARLRGELANIANARRFDREYFDDDTAFVDWAQSRARHAIGEHSK